MRIASWALIVCAMVAALGLFMPCLEVRIHGALLSKRTTLSLYSANNHEDLVRKLLRAYRTSSRRHLGATVIEAARSRVHGRLGDALGDARDAMDTLDDVTDDDVRHAGTALAATVWTFLGLASVVIALAFVETMRASYRKRRLVAALVATVFIAAIGVAIFLGCRELAWEANDELGADAVKLGIAAYVIPIASVSALASAVLLLVRRSRERLSLTPL